MSFHTLDEIMTFQATVHAPGDQARPGHEAQPPGGGPLLRVDRMDAWTAPAPSADPPLCFCYTYAAQPDLSPAAA
jgi:hypothetical protein